MYPLVCLPRRFYVVQVPKRQGGKCRLLMTAKHRLPVRSMSISLFSSSTVPKLDSNQLDHLVNARHDQLPQRIPDTHAGCQPTGRGAHPGPDCACG